MVVVPGMDFYEDIIFTCGVMAFDHFWYLLKLFYHVGEFGWVSQEKAYVGTSLVSYL